MGSVSHGRFVRLNDIYIALHQSVAGDGNFEDVERTLGIVKLRAVGVNFGCPFLYTWSVVKLHSRRVCKFRLRINLQTSRSVILCLYYLNEFVSFYPYYL